MKTTLFTDQLSRRKFLCGVLAGSTALVFAGSGARALAQGSAATPLDVYKDPTCGCCSNWIDHMQQSGFSSTVYHPSDLNGLKLQHGIRPELQSCHTAITEEGYAFEGHVPAKLIKQFLDNPPANGKGLMAPGMPMGSPGMEMGDRFTPYDVVLLNKDGTTSVYASIKNAAEQY